MFGLPAGGTRRSVRGLDVDARVVPLLEEMVGEYRPALLALMVATGLVLLIVVGLLASAGSVRLLESFLFGVTGDHQLTLGAPLVLAGVALVACWLPGHRAARIDPMDALRVEWVARSGGRADCPPPGYAQVVAAQTAPRRGCHGRTLLPVRAGLGVEV